MRRLTRQLINGCLVSSCLGGLPAAAQTGRIAHFSHGGSVATLATEQAAADNFGEPMPYFVPDSVRYLSSKMALSYGKWYWGRVGSTTDTLKFPEAYSVQQAAKYTRQLYTRARLIGFDSVSSPRKAAPTVKQSPKSRRRKKAVSLSFPLPPAGPGLQPGVLAVLALAGAGWLLAGKAPLGPQAAS